MPYKTFRTITVKKDIYEIAEKHAIRHHRSVGNYIETMILIMDKKYDGD